MWMNITQARIDPMNVKKVVEILSQTASLEPILSAHGFNSLYLVESTERPGEIKSITVWETAEDGQAYIASPECQEVIGGIQEYALAPLERHYHTVHIMEPPPKKQT